MENKKIANGVLIFGEYYPSSSHNSSKVRDPNKRPLCRNIYTGKEAYSRYQLSAYIDEILQIKRDKSFVESRNLFQQIFLLSIFLNAKNFVEIGSTLFASIDKYERCLKLYEKSYAINYIGIEPNDLLRDTAESLHQHIKLSHFHYHSEIDQFPTSTVGRSYQATSYAFSSTEELVDWISNFDASQDGIWFSPDENDRKISAFGNELTLFSYQNFHRLMKNKGYYLNIMTAQKVKHIESELYEVFIVSHKIEDCDLFNINVEKRFHIDNNDYPCFEHAREIQPDRTVPQEQGNLIDSMNASGVLDFTSKSILAKI